MKSLICALTLCCLCAFADSKITIPVGKPGEQEVWFIDLSKITIQAGSLQLVTDAGVPVPFSLDKRYVPVQTKGKTVLPPDGYNTSYFQKLENNTLEHLGYISFKNPKGCKNLYLKFVPGKAKITVQTNPKVRAWWIELFKDPFFQKKLGNPYYGVSYDSAIKNKNNVIIMQNSKNPKYKPTVFFGLDILDFRKELAGRYVNAVVIAEKKQNEFGNLIFDLPNGQLPKISCIAMNMKKAPGGKFIGLTEGIVAEGKPMHGKRSWSNITMPVGSKVYELHLQSSPTSQKIALRPQSTRVNAGDLLKVQKVNFGKNVMQPCFVSFDNRQIPALHEIPAGKQLQCALELADKQGKVIASSKTEQIRIPKTAAGEYSLRMKITDAGGIGISAETLKIQVQKSPW